MPGSRLRAEGGELAPGWRRLNPGPGTAQDTGDTSQQNRDAGSLSSGTFSEPNDPPQFPRHQFEHPASWEVAAHRAWLASQN